MTIKKFFIILCSMLILGNTTVFAYNITEKEIQDYPQENIMHQNKKK